MVVGLSSPCRLMAATRAKAGTVVQAMMLYRDDLADSGGGGSGGAAAVAVVGEVFGGEETRTILIPCAVSSWLAPFNCGRVANKLVHSTANPWSMHP